LLGIARHKVESHYRSLLREPLPLDEETQESMAVEPMHDERMDRVRLAEFARQVIGTLPEPYAAALLWRYWEKRSAAEMAWSRFRISIVLIQKQLFFISSNRN
jgi:DNA-directed RNA polymerase specialized sigma24 family protein